MSSEPPQLESRALTVAGAHELVAHAAAGMSAGMPLDEIFLALAEEADNRSLRAVANRIAAELRQGADVQSALSSVSGALPPYLQRALSAATNPGQTASVVAGLAHHETTRRRLRRQLRSALIYPVLVFSMLAAIVSGVTVFIVPQFQGIYSELDLELPPLTFFLLNTAFAVPWALGTLAVVAIGVLIAARLRPTVRMVHWLRTAVPLVGRLWIWSGQHEFASILGEMVRQQTPLEDALPCTAASLRDQNLARSVRIVADKCAGGDTLSKALSESIHFDPALPALVGWGELQGTLGDALRDAARTFEEDLDLHAAFLQRVMPSVLFIGVITTMFFFVMGLMYPVISLINSLTTWPPAPSTSMQMFNQEQIVPASLTLVALGLCLRLSLRLLYGARGPAADDGIYLMMRILGWGLFVLPMAVLSVGGANWLSLVLLAAVAEALFELLLARRAAQRQSVWRLIVGAIQARRSPVEALRLHQNRFTGLVGRWQRRLTRDLEQGVAWPLAIWKNRAATPRVAPAFAAMAASGAGLENLPTDFDDADDPVTQQMQQQTVQRFIYLGTVAAVLVAIAIFVLVKIVPSFQSIFEDFDLSLPSITVAMISLSLAVERVFGEPVELWTGFEIPPMISLFIFVLVPAVLVIGILYLCDIPVLQRLTDRLTLFRQRSRVMQLLAVAFDQGVTVDAALTQLCNGRTAYPSRVVRRRLAAARRAVLGGNEWQDALERAGLISRSDVVVLRSAQAAGNLPWALRLLAERKVRVAIFRWSLVQQIVFVALVLFFGFIVFWFAVAMLVPLSDLIISLT